MDKKRKSQWYTSAKQKIAFKLPESKRVPKAFVYSLICILNSQKLYS